MPRSAKSSQKKKAAAPKKDGSSRKEPGRKPGAAKKSQKKEEAVVQAASGRGNKLLLVENTPKKEDEALAGQSEVETDPDVEPYALGSTILVRWKPDGSARLCTVIERAKIDDESWRYYVHYIDFNRRMDEWVSGSYLLEKPSLAVARAKEIAMEAAAAAHAATQAIKALQGNQNTDSTNAIQEEGNKENDDDDNNNEEDEEEGVQLVVEGYEHTAGSGALDFGTLRGANTTQTKEEKESSNLTTKANGDEELTTRKRKRRHSESLDGTIIRMPSTVTTANDMEHDEHEGLDEASLKEHEEVTKVKNIGQVELGRHIMDTWYFSPFPKEIYPNGYTQILYVCEFSFSFFTHRSELERFQNRHQLFSPPGDEIYRHDGLAMFEVDGNQHTTYCQNLCYFAKLFLDHKTLYFDVDPFLFYVLTEYDQYGYHPVGYYSKEKYSEVGYNLACILTFPPYQRKGYGRFLIAFSYALSRKEGKVGAPEKPLSDLGHVSYRSYWSSTLVHYIRSLVSTNNIASTTPNGGRPITPNNSTNVIRAVSIMELSKATSIMADDVIATLQYLGLIRCINGTYILWASMDVLDRLAERYPVKTPVVNTDALHWAPYVNFDIKRDKFSIRAKRPTPMDPSLVE